MPDETANVARADADNRPAPREPRYAPRLVPRQPRARTGRREPLKPSTRGWGGLPPLSHWTPGDFRAYRRAETARALAFAAGLWCPGAGGNPDDAERQSSRLATRSYVGLMEALEIGAKSRTLRVPIPDRIPALATG